eukprot:1064239-Pleurochrysis_carterae.AAC.1
MRQKSDLRKGGTGGYLRSKPIELEPKAALKRRAASAGDDRCAPTRITMSTHSDLCVRGF